MKVDRRFKIGAHMPVSKGFYKVPYETKEIGGNSFQIFNHSPRTWKCSWPNDKEITKFKNSMRDCQINFDNAFVHSGYLVNLASPKDDVWEKSIRLLIEEIKTCELLGLKYLNIHPGSHLGEGEEYGLKRIITALNRVFKVVENSDVIILLENVSPKGGNIGYKFEHLGYIMSEFKGKVAITYDTCHGFDAGYDITTHLGMKKLIEEIEQTVRIENIKMIHLNDSKYPLASAKDRHENIGKGYIGINGFRNFLSFEEFQNIPLILETPGSNLEHAEDIRILQTEILNKI